MGKRLYFCGVKDEADHREYRTHRTLTLTYNDCCFTAAVVFIIAVME